MKHEKAKAIMQTHSAVIGILLCGFVAGCTSLEERGNLALTQDDVAHAYLAIGGVT